MNKQEIIERCVNEKQAVKISMLVGNKRRMVLLDVMTANAVKTVFDHASIDHKQKLESLRWDRLISLTWANVEIKKVAG